MKSHTEKAQKLYKFLQPYLHSALIANEMSNYCIELGLICLHNTKHFMLCWFVYGYKAVSGEKKKAMLSLNKMPKKEKQEIRTHESFIYNPEL